jgi:purine-binding chemotaxis protein CheW
MSKNHTSRQELISFRVDDQEFCIDIMPAREIREWSPTVPLPEAPGFVRGVVNLRGTILPVIDLGNRIISCPSCRHCSLSARRKH